MSLMMFYFSVLLTGSGGLLGTKIAAAARNDGMMIPDAFRWLTAFSKLLCTVLIIGGFVWIGMLRGVLGALTGIAGAATVQTVIEGRGYTPIVPVVISVVGCILGIAWIARVAMAA